MVNYEQRRGGQGNSSLSIHHSSFIILTSPLALQNALQRLPGLAEAIKAGDEERQALEAGQRARLPNDDRDPSAAKQQGQKRSQAAEARLAGFGKQLVKKIHASVLSYQRPGDTACGTLCAAESGRLCDRASGTLGPEV